LASTDELKRLSYLLDSALDLSPAEREVWLDALDGESAALRPQLRDLLARAGAPETGDLLARGPAFTAPAADTGPAFAAGQLVGPYRLLGELGRGGMCEVWLAERADGQLKREVALKLPMLGLRRDLLVQRFARERDILGGLVHPHIARLYDAGLAEDGQPYLALEYVAGVPITDYATAHALPPRERVLLLLQVLAAVQHAHAHLVIHRDLKPSNVLVDADGQVKLLDFGIAKLLQADQEEAGATELTQLGGRALTPAYAAPEQVAGAPVSTATDVWALGVLAYELLAGRRPFEGERRVLEQAILAQEPARPRSLAGDLATVLLKALKKAPPERYATADAFAEDLRRWLDGRPVHAQPDSAWYRTRRFVGRNKVAVATAAGVLASVLAAAGVALQQAREAQAQSRVARTEAATAEAVQRFLEGVFRANSANQADPLKARQRTAKELLDEGAARIDTELDEAPRAKLRVLKTLARMYAGMEQFDDAARLHAREADLALRLEGPHGPSLVEALSLQVVEHVGNERMKDAAAAMQAASAAASGATLAPDAKAAWLLAQARFTWKTEPARCVPPATELVALARQRPPSSLLPEALDLLGACLQASGRDVEAVLLLEESIALAQQPQTRSTSTLFGTYQYLGRAHERLGQPQAAEQAYRHSVDTATRHHGEHSKVRMIALVTLGQALMRQDRMREAFEAYRGAVEVLRALPALDEPFFRIATYVSAVGSYVAMGHLAEARQLLDDADAAARREPPRATWPIQLQVFRAELEIESGADAEARAALDRARELLRAAPPSARRWWGAVADLRLTLALRAHDAKAAADAVDEARRGLGDGAVDWRASWATQAGCLAAVMAPDAAAARHACEPAIAALQAAPPGPRRTLNVANLRWAWGRRLLEERQGAAALALLREAVAGLDAAVDPERSPALLEPLLTLEKAARAAGDARTASAAHERARRLAAALPPRRRVP